MNRSNSQRRQRRSLFFVPGGEPRKLQKCLTSGADTLLLDLEDSVALDDKDRARKLVAAALRAGGFGSSEPGVRVNPPGTAYFEADLEAVIMAGARAVMLPKAETAEGIVAVAERIDALSRRRDIGEPVALLVLVETAAGIVNLPELIRVAPNIDAFCFGHADFSRDMGLAATTPDAGSVLHARTTLAIAAKAARRTTIDTVFLDVRDSEAFRRDAERGRALGFDGKLCIHPSQVDIANEVYTPTVAEIDHARRVIDAYQSAKRDGRGVFAVDGKMVDAPLIEIQRDVLARARKAGVVTDSAPVDGEKDDDAGHGRKRGN